MELLLVLDNGEETVCDMLKLDVPFFLLVKSTLNSQSERALSQTDKILILKVESVEKKKMSKESNNGNGVHALKIQNRDR